MRQFDVTVERVERRIRTFRVEAVDGTSAEAAALKGAPDMTFRQEGEPPAFVVRSCEAVVPAEGKVTHCAGCRDRGTVRRGPPGAMRDAPCPYCKGVAR